MEFSHNGFQLNVNDTLKFVSPEEILAWKTEVQKANEFLMNKNGRGREFLGWMSLPSDIIKKSIKKINNTAELLRKKSDLIVVVGIGGSYLGARAVIDALSHSFKTLLGKKKKYPLVIYAGQNLGEDYHSNLLDVLNKNDYSVIVISKSGTTTEPAVAFRILKNHLEKKYGKKEARKRIVAVTDESRGALKKLSDSEGYKTFVIPDDVGGRYSVLTPVGLLPVATAGLDIKELIRGAKDMQEFIDTENSIVNNPAMLYAAVRNALHRKGKAIEILASYTPNLNYFIEWWKQLYGESEGKNGKGIFPAGVNFTTDLHSMGQWIQDGTRNIFETVLWVENSSNKLTVPSDENNLDDLNYIAGKRLNEINQKAMLGTAMAHVDGGVPNIFISVPKLNEYYLGQLIYFFERACGISGYVLGVNPFDQPGVEAYKKNMFALLGKQEK
jgi:glucose-6-phosphate isomerase